MLISTSSPVEGEDTYGVGQSITGLGETDKTQEQVHAMGKTQDRGNSKSQKAIPSTCEGLGKSILEAYVVWPHCCMGPTWKDREATQCCLVKPVESLKTWAVIQICFTCPYHPWCPACSHRVFKDSHPGYRMQAKIVSRWGPLEASCWAPIQFPAAAAKSLQLCPTLCDPIDGSPRGSPIPGKNTGVGCHFLLQCMKVKSEREVAESCLTLSDPMDCSPPGSSIHGIFQARVLEWGATAFSDLQFPSNKQKVMALGQSYLLRWPTLCEVCFSLNKSTSLRITLKKKESDGSGWCWYQMNSNHGNPQKQWLMVLEVEWLWSERSFCIGYQVFACTRVWGFYLNTREHVRLWYYTRSNFINL